MATALNNVTEIDIKLLENGKEGCMLYKGNDITFVYNRLNLGKGSLYITSSKFIWIKNEEAKKQVTDFKDIATDNIYLNYYEKNREAFMNLLNKVNNISIESSNIALHALSSDRKLYNDDCVYIQLNNDIFDTVQKENSEEDDDEDGVIGKMENGNQTNDKDDKSEEGSMFVSHTITPEILLIGGNKEVNNNIFQQLSNFDDCVESDSIDDHYSEVESDSQINENGNEKENIKDK